MAVLCTMYCILWGIYASQLVVLYILCVYTRPNLAFQIEVHIRVPNYGVLYRVLYNVLYSVYIYASQLRGYCTYSMYCVVYIGVYIGVPNELYRVLMDI